MLRLLMLLMFTGVGAFVTVEPPLPREKDERVTCHGQAVGIFRRCRCSCHPGMYVKHKGPLADFQSRTGSLLPTCCHCRKTDPEVKKANNARNNPINNPRNNPINNPRNNPRNNPINSAKNSASVAATRYKAAIAWEADQLIPGAVWQRTNQVEVTAEVRPIVLRVRELVASGMTVYVGLTFQHRVEPESVRFFGPSSWCNPPFKVAAGSTLTRSTDTDYPTPAMARQLEGFGTLVMFESDIRHNAHMVEKATHAALMDLTYPRQRMWRVVGALGETLYGRSCAFLTWFSQSNIGQEIVIDTDEPAADEPVADGISAATAFCID